MEAEKERHEGVMKFYRADKGYGFAILDRTHRDVFVHASQVSALNAELLDERGAPLREGDRVSFEIEERERGPYARDVQLVVGGK